MSEVEFTGCKGQGKHFKHIEMRIVLKSGIYIITNKANGKYYIGESKNIHVRMRLHKSDLLRNDHQNIHLQRAFNKYGEENFEFKILEECEVENLKAREHYWCGLLKSHNDRFGYNIRGTTIEQKLGAISEKSKMRMSIAKKGKPLSKEHCRRLSLAQQKRGIGQYRSPSAKKRIAIANIERSKPVFQIDLTGSIIKKWDSRILASQETGIGVSGINNVTLGYRKTAGGYIWKFAA